MKRKNREIGIFSMSALDLFASALGAFILLVVVIFPYFPNTGMAEQAELDEALERLREAAEEDEALRQIYDELDAAITELREELASCLTRADQLETELQETRDRVHQLERLLEDQDTLRGELEACRAETESQREQIENQREQIENQREQIENQRGQIENQRGQIENQREQIENQRGQIENQEDRIADLERRKFILVTISWGGQRGDDVDLHIIDPYGNEYYFAGRSYPDSDARFEEDSLNGPGNEVWLQPQAIPGRYEIYYNPFSLASSQVTVRGRVVHPASRQEFRPRQLTPNGRRQLIATLVVDDQGNLTVNEN